MDSSLDSTASKDALSIRIITIDHIMSRVCVYDNCMAKDSGKPKHQNAPVIRIFGDSPTGQKTCVHIHQVYPYFYVDYKGKLDRDTVTEYLQKFKRALNHSLCVLLHRSPSSPTSQFIRKVALVKGVPLYGFHCSYSPFIKVYLVNPSHALQATTALRKGSVMSTRFNVFESHLSFILQFMADYGLYGCGNIEIGNAFERRAEDEDSEHRFERSTVPRQSTCALELDVVAPEIRNRLSIKPRHLHTELHIPNQVSKFITDPPVGDPDPLVPSVKELWDEERRRRTSKGLNPSPEMPMDLSASKRGDGGGWYKEARWWDDLRKRLDREEEERMDVDGKDERENVPEWEDWCPTAFESVECVWEERYKVWKPYKVKGKKDKDKEVIVLDGADEEENEDVDLEILNGPVMTQISLSQEEQEKEDEDAKRDLPPDEDEDEEVEENQEMQVDSKEDKPEFVQGSSTDARPRDQTQLTFPLKSAMKSQSGSERPNKRRRITFEDELAPAPNQLANRSAFAVLFGDEDSAEEEEKNRTPASSWGRDGASYRLSLVEDGGEGEAEEFRSSLSSSGSGSGSGSQSQASQSQSQLLTQSQSDSSVLSSSPETPLYSSQEQEYEEEPPALSYSYPKNTYTYTVAPPSRTFISSTLDQHLPAVANYPIGHVAPQHASYGQPHYSDPRDFPRVYVNAPGVRKEQRAVVKQGPRSLLGLDEFECGIRPNSRERIERRIGKGKGRRRSRSRDRKGKAKEGTGARSQGYLASQNPSGAWEYASEPPSYRVVKRWCEEQAEKAKVEDENASAEVKRERKPVGPGRGLGPSQIEGPTQEEQSYKVATQTAKEDVIRQRNEMSILALEVLVPTRKKLKPDPNVDTIAAVFYAYKTSSPIASPSSSPSEPGDTSNSDTNEHVQLGIIAQISAGLYQLRDVYCADPAELKFEEADDEADLIRRVIELVGKLDPDILCGWEVVRSSWGYLIKRGKDLHFTSQIARAPASRDAWLASQGPDRPWTVVGRHVLDVWKIVRGEFAFAHYTFENAVFELLKIRVPKYSHETITRWFASELAVDIDSVVQYYKRRTALVLDILDATDVVTKTAEFARVFGVDFYDVISRGSQFKVESFMSRIAKPESLVMLSPSKEDVGSQNAPECIPLIMEPISAMYNNPLVVLDFQSLYPSIMIAHNICYTTCLGRVNQFQGRNKFGVTNLDLPSGLLERLKDHIHVSANGLMYVNQNVRKGLLGRMLSELLDTRVMVKSAMKGAGDDRNLRRILDARQMGLKFISNVTYGYTSATYSGRMPAVEIADSIVQCGRETLEKAIMFIEQEPKWDGKVVYGDTDSLFVYLPGKTKDQAFKIGYDIAAAVTAMNPAPVKLKFEKVYLPCLLFTKKRYVGFKYENPDDVEPEFDAKGIETVRRDGIGAQRKMVEKSIKILFRTQDLSQVKAYCLESWQKIHEERASVQDFVFAREVRLGTYSKKVLPQPGVMVAMKRRDADLNDEVLYGERVPYVITRHPDFSQLAKRAYDPLAFMNNDSAHLDAEYYIRQVLIPPLDRIFKLMGANVEQWYNQMPRKKTAHIRNQFSSPNKRNSSRRKVLITDHFQWAHCVICRRKMKQGGVCIYCRTSPSKSIPYLTARIAELETKFSNAQAVCASCSSRPLPQKIECESLDCPNLYSRKKAESLVEVVEDLYDLIGSIKWRVR